MSNPPTYHSRRKSEHRATNNTERHKERGVKISMNQRPKRLAGLQGELPGEIGSIDADQEKKRTLEEITTPVVVPLPPPAGTVFFHCPKTMALLKTRSSAVKIKKAGGKKNAASVGESNTKSAISPAGSEGNFAFAE